MFKRITQIYLLMALLFAGYSHAAAFQTQDKIYIDSDSFKANTKGEEFYFHVGNNIWLVTHTIHRDGSGMFAYECELSKTVAGAKMDYERKWKCPYCYTYWPVGNPCGNPDC